MLAPGCARSALLIVGPRRPSRVARARHARTLRELERTHHRRALGQHLFVFRLRNAVGNDAGARLITVLITPEDERTDGNRVVHVAAGAEVADSASVQPTAHGLQLIDDLHRPYFRRTDERARRKRRCEQVERIAPRRQLAVDAAYDVHDMAVAFDRAIRIDLYAAGAGHAAEIVARQIDKHDVLSVLLRVSAQLGLARQIDGSVIGTRASAGDGP